VVTTPQDARSRVLLLFLAGVALLAVGALIFFTQLPSGQTDFIAYGPLDDADLPDLGNPRLALGGAAIAGAGFLVILVPIVACGVRLGQLLGQPEGD
jgi:hypothetical protein